MTHDYGGGGDDEDDDDVSQKQKKKRLKKQRRSGKKKRLKKKKRLLKKTDGRKEKKKTDEENKLYLYIYKGTSLQGQQDLRANKNPHVTRHKEALYKETTTNQKPRREKEKRGKLYHQKPRRIDTTKLFLNKSQSAHVIDRQTNKNSSEKEGQQLCVCLGGMSGLIFPHFFHLRGTGAGSTIQEQNAFR